MIGFISLLLALVTVEATILLYISGIRRKQARLINLGKKGALITCAYITAASLWLFYLLVSRDFQTVYVARYTSRDLPLLYTISAFWAGTEGSLLFWVWLLSIFTVVIVLREREDDKLTPYAVPILALVVSFFLILLLYPSNPFVKFDRRPVDGYGLNPLLQDPGMLLHPPTLFVGYAGFTIPFAFAMAGFIAENDEWIYRVRKWTLFSWIFLSIGIGMGAWWSYHVL